MQRSINEEAREDLLERGYSRRQLAGIAAVFGFGALAASAGASEPGRRRANTPGAIDVSGARRHHPASA